MLSTLLVLGIRIQPPLQLRGGTSVEMAQLVLQSLPVQVFSCPFAATSWATAAREAMMAVVFILTG
jgi:hypothetical protein